MLGRLAVLGAAQAFVVGWVLHSAHSDPAEAHEVVYVSPALHFLRDSALAVPLAVAALLVATLVVRRVPERWLGQAAGMRARVAWAAAGALAFAVGSVPAAVVHDRLFVAGHGGVSFLGHAASEGMLAWRWSFALLVVFAAVWGVPWRARGARAQAHPAPAQGSAC